jgi:hypothetical protein
MLGCREVCVYSTDRGSIPGRGNAIASRPVLGHTRPPIQWVLGVLSPEVRRPEREADHSHPTGAKVRKAWSYASSPPDVFMAWYLVKHTDSFTITLRTEFVDDLHDKESA